MSIHYRTKFKPTSASIDAYSKDLNRYLIRNYKYLQTVKQFHQSEDIPQILATRFFKKLHAAKKLSSLTLKIGVTADFQIRPQVVNTILRIHSQHIRNVDVTNLLCKLPSSPKSPIRLMKNLLNIYTEGQETEIKDLGALRKVQCLSIDLTNSQITPEQLYYALLRLRSLEILSILPAPSHLEGVLEVLNRLSLSFSPETKVKIATKIDEDYSAVPILNLTLQKKIHELRLQYISEASVLDNLLLKPMVIFANLKILKLEFVLPDLELATRLKYLGDFESLESLSLYFTECWSKEFSEKAIQSLRLPCSLKKFKMRMSLFLQGLIAKNRSLIEGAQIKLNKFIWRSCNLFEEEPLFVSFYETIKGLNYLRKLTLDFQMLENFSSQYTNFFVSILERLPTLSYFATHVQNNQGYANEVPECFDLALMLDTCAKCKNLEYIEIYMPNILFENAKLSPGLISLKVFNIGVTEQEGQEAIKFDNISKYIRQFLKILSQNHAQLTSLVLDFTEIIDEDTFRKRFHIIEKFKDLKYLGLRFIIRECDTKTIKNAGRALQSLGKLDTVVLGFLESDKSTIKIKAYLKYLKSVRDILLTCDNSIWVGHDYEEELEYNDVFCIGR